MFIRLDYEEQGYSTRYATAYLEVPDGMTQEQIEMFLDDHNGEIECELEWGDPFVSHSDTIREKPTVVPNKPEPKEQSLYGEAPTTIIDFTVEAKSYMEPE